MNDRTRLVLHRYLPFALILAMQGLVVLLVPSTGHPGRGSANVAQGTSSYTGTGAVGGGAGTGTAAGRVGAGTVSTAPSTRAGVSSSAPASPASGASRVGSSPGGPVAPAGVAAGVDPNAAGAWPWTMPWTLSGDRSHCAKGGKLQENITLVAPPCVPAFTGNNGGSTYSGVSGKSITVVIYRAASNAAADAILNSQGLTESAAQEQQAIDVFGKFFNKHYEFYGRTVKWVMYRGACDGTDPTCVRQDARALVQQYHPFYVIWDTSQFPEFHDEMARLGVVNSGGWSFNEKFMTQHSPYVYDLYPDGDTIDQHSAAYWCKKMVGKKATLAGDATLQSQKRKLGIVVQNYDAYKQNATDLEAMVEKCGTGNVPVLTYDYDISRAQEQMTAVVTSLRQDGVTTVACLCDPVMPVFLTNAADQQQYHPEWLLAGNPANTHDLLGRLYAADQWAHAFGPSMRPKEVPEDQADSAKAWSDVGASGSPQYAALNVFMWMRMAAMQMEWAGPNLTPHTLHRATVSAPQIGGYHNAHPWPGYTCCNPYLEEHLFGPNDYTAIQDAKSVYWSSSTPSAVDGKPGSYVCVDRDCRRYDVGDWTAGQPGSAGAGG